MDDGARFDAGPPPMGGLGNFKGVMLCNRPSDEPSRAAHAGGGEAPFRSMVSATHGDKIGLTPCKNFEPSVKTRGPSAALRRHVKWLRELQEQMRTEREQAEAENGADEARRQRLQAAFEKQREGVRQMMRERDNCASTAYLDAPAREESAPRRVATKPLWAMTEKEKDDHEEDEADELLNFADNLDYDKIVGDLEFRHEAVRDRTGRLQKEQDAFKTALVKDVTAGQEGEEDEAASTFEDSPEHGVDGIGLLGDAQSEFGVGSNRKLKGDERSQPDGWAGWDASTSCGEDRGESATGREARSAADMVLEAAPQLKAIHSRESMQRIIEKTRDRLRDAPCGLVEMMHREGAVAVPVIVASEDTQHRLHKPVEPSLLPYLYRSPAI